MSEAKPAQPAVEVDPEDVILAQMGYKQELKRGFNALMAVSFCFTAVAVMSSSSILFSFGLQTGGPVVMIWGWLVTSFFTILSGMAMAEICSTFPSAGSVYHWAGQLATAEQAPLLSYITGWFNFLGNAAGDAAFAFGFADAAASAYEIHHETPLSISQVVGIAIAISLVWALLNALRVDQQGWVNNFAALFQVVTSLGIVIALLVAPSDRQPTSFVFTHWHNGTGYSNTAYVCVLGLLFSAYSFSGYEAGAHMAEETQNASTAAPWGIVTTVLCVAVVGFGYILGLLYATQGIENVIEGGIVRVYTDACGTNGGLALAALLVLNLFFAGMSSLTVTSRIGFAMARDGAFPFSDVIKVVNPRVHMPLRTVAVVFLVDVLLLLIPLGSTVAFSAVTSISAIGFQVSYAIPLLLRVTVARKTFKQGAFNLGRASLTVHTLACIWLFASSVIFFFPTAHPIDSANMNYAVAVVGGVAVVGAVYWWYWGRRFFKGPLREGDEGEHGAVVVPASSPISARGADVQPLDERSSLTLHDNLAQRRPYSPQAQFGIGDDHADSDSPSRSPQSH